MALNTISSLLSSYTQRTLSLSKDDHDKLKYSLQVFLGEASKLWILYMIYQFFNVQLEFMMAFLALMFIRSNTGGLHFKTYFGCLAFSFTFFSAAILLFGYSTFSNITMIIVGFTGFLILASISPITSTLRPEYSRAQRLRFKHIGCLVICFHLIGFIAIKNNPYFEISVWVIFIQSIQLLIAKGVKHYEKKLSL